MTRRRLAAINASRETVLAEQVEDGASFWAKFKGLMGRRTLPQGEGLWLPDANNIHMLFMRFPIDAVFLSKADARGRRTVVGMRRALPPWRGVVWWVRGGKGVIELPAGTIDRTGTALGDQVELAPEGTSAASDGGRPAAAS